MSIISDALKKIESERGKETLHPKRNRRIVFMFLSLMLIIVTFLTYVFLLRTEVPDFKPDPKNLRYSEESESSSLLPSSPIPLDYPDDKMPSLELKGIAHFGEENWAIINDRIVKEGQFIEGAKIEKILSEHIDITFEGKKSTLEIK